MTVRVTPAVPKPFKSIGFINIVWLLELTEPNLSGPRILKPTSPWFSPQFNWEPSPLMLTVSGPSIAENPPPPGAVCVVGNPHTMF